MNHVASTAHCLTQLPTDQAEAYDDALRQYGWLVHNIAAGLARRMPPNVELDDLKSAGIVGLLDATQRFDDNKGGNFRAYADLRIRGAIMDELRTLDWVPRSVRQKETTLARAERRVRERQRRPGTDAELAAELEIDIDAVRTLRLKAQVGTLVRSSSLGGEGNFFDTLPDLDASNAETLAVRQGERELVQDAIALLPDRERDIVRKSFFENMRLRDIGDAMSLTESRISQLRTQALANLRRNVVRLRGQSARTWGLCPR